MHLEIVLLASTDNVLPLRFRKAGRVWYGGAGGAHWAAFHNGVAPC